MERNKDYLRHAIIYLNLITQISGHECNIPKTKVIPIAHFDKENKLYPDIKLYWKDDFTLLGFYIDNILDKLDMNIEKIDQK